MSDRTFAGVARRIRADRGVPLATVDDVDVYLSADEYGDVVLIRQGNAVVRIGPEAVSPLVDALWLAEMASYCNATDPPVEQDHAPAPKPSRKSPADRGAISFAPDGWREPIATYLEGRHRVTVTEVIERALQADTASTAIQRRVAEIMLDLGWQRGQRTRDDRWWVNGESVTDNDAPATAACRVASPSIKRS